MNQSVEKLYEIAQAQQGYFTARQARTCGYPTSNQVYHVKTGSWVRMHRGIYRLAKFPILDDGQFVLWSLWSANRQGQPQGVFSHQTALTLFDLSDGMPQKIHLTVPPKFRRFASTPQILTLHYGTFIPSEIEIRQGYQVTRPLKSISDLLQEPGTPIHHIRQALMQGLARGVITRSELDSHPSRQQLQLILKGKKA
jgi:predicted transcriptional regulator of viral defense system